MTSVLVGRLRFPVCAVLCGVALGGCESSGGPGYKDVQLHEVVVVTDKDGTRRVAIVQNPFIAFEEVIERSPNVSTVARVTSLSGARVPKTFDVSPDGEAVIFDALETVQGASFTNLWRVGARGTGGMSRVTAGNYFDLDPAYAPNGGRIYFTSNRNSPDPDLWSVNSSGAGGISMLTRGDADDRRPFVSSADGRVFYESVPRYASGRQIWSVDADGGLPTQLTEGEQPIVSPDGSRVLFSRQDPASGELKVWVMESDGLNPTQLTSGPGSNDIHAAWSPDGARIVFASNMAKDSNGRKNYDIWLMDSGGGNVTQLTTNGSTDFYPRFSPDGSTVFFLSNRGFDWEIWRMDILRY